MRNSVRLVMNCVVGVGAALLPAGCIVETDAPPPPPAVVMVDGPVVDDPSVVLIDVEPAPPDRVYVYDPGFPPGTYFYGGFYYYGGYRYPHDVFINRYVVVNVREHRFADPGENRRAAAPIIQQHRAQYAARRQAAPAQPQRAQEHRDNAQGH